MSEGTSTRSKAWRWGVCFLLLAATMINYMDRLTLSTTSKRLMDELTMGPAKYGFVETGFSLGFATGSILFGILADKMRLRILYPIVLLLWSTVGFATGLVQNTMGVILCRSFLGVFEAGHWPCALRTIRMILEPKDRTMGNGLLQSGASLGAVLTPLVVQAFLDHGMGWRAPYLVIGAVGALWAVVWIVVIRPSDLPPEPPAPAEDLDDFVKAVFSPRFFALVCMLSMINIAWQLLRAWLPLFLREGRGYTEAQANYFTIPYYISTDLGALAAGALTLGLVRKGATVFGSRIRVYAGMAMLAALTLAAAFQPQGVLLLVTLLIIGFGLLGVFPCYYAFAQEVSDRHVGKITGLLGVCGWLATSFFQWLFGSVVESRKSYDLPMALVGLAPLVGLLLFRALWTPDPVERRTS